MTEPSLDLGRVGGRDDIECRVVGSNEGSYWTGRLERKQKSKKKACDLPVGKGGAPETGPVAPAAKVVYMVTVPWRGIPDVIADNGGITLPSMVLVDVPEVPGAVVVPVPAALVVPVPATLVALADPLLLTPVLAPAPEVLCTPELVAVAVPLPTAAA